MLCQRCRRWVLQVIDFASNHVTDEISLDTVTLVEDDMRRRIYNGCHVCKRLLAHLRGWGSSTVSLDVTVGDDLYLTPTSPCRYRLFFAEKDHFSASWAFVAFWIDLSPSPEQCYVYPRPLIAARSPKASKARSRFAVAKRWLEECVNLHVSCRNQIRNYVPKRLLRISRRLGETMCHLVSRHATPFQLKYCTLSHRWGPQDQQLKLIAQTESVLSGGVVPIHLTTLVSEAVEIAQILSIQYLWVDSLCIMQDDAAELQEQIQDMGKIYGHAVCNVMALAGQPDRRFETREYANIDPTHPSASFLNRTSSGRMVVNLLEEGYWEKEVEQAPLLQRGWVLQERFSAQRTLFIGQKELFWECCMGRRCELYPRIAVWSGDLKPIRQLSHMYHGNENVLQAIRFSSQVEAPSQTARLSNGRMHDMLEGWRDLIRRYSALQLTFPSDRIAAIRGIAHVFSELTNCGWVAGIWQEDLQASLLWYTPQPEPLEPIKLGRVSSWSWASRSGLVLFDNAPRWPLIPLSALVSVKSLANQELGNPLDAGVSLTLTAAVFQVVKFQPAATFGILDGNSIYGVEIRLDMAGDCESEIGSVSRPPWGYHRKIPLPRYDTPYEILDSSFKCVMLAGYKYYSPSRPARVMGLL